MAVVQILAQSAGPQGSGATDDDSDPEAAETARLATLMPIDETQLLYSICLHGRADLGLAPDEYAALTMVLLRLLAFKPQGQAAPAEKKTLNKAVAPSPVRLAAPPTPVPAAVHAVSVVAKPEVVPRPVAVPVKALAVQPWEDAPAEAPAVVQSGDGPQTPANFEPEPEAPLPPGQVLAVRDNAPPSAPQEDDDFPAEAEGFESNQALAPVISTQMATKIVAVPVRIQAESRSDMAPQQAAPVLVPTEEGDFWHATVQQLIKAEAINAMVRELALQSQLVARDTDQWILRVERESLNQAGTRDRLTTALQSAGFGVKLVVEIGRVTDCPARRNNAASAEKQLAAEKIIFDDPYVQAMMRDFGAKIVPGSIKPI